MEKVRESGQARLLLWQAGFPAVVLGRSQVMEKEVYEEECRVRGVPVLRRASGGGAVFQMPGVFNYSLILPEKSRLSIRGGFRLGTGLIQDVLRRLGLESALQGVSDVTVGGRKISGNAVAQVNRVLLVHGTLLAEMDMSLLEACLRRPSREPDYRKGRSHREFLTTLTALRGWGGDLRKSAAPDSWKRAIPYEVPTGAFTVAGSHLLSQLGQHCSASAVSAFKDVSVV
ncbi:Biotinyl protein ligase (BPL) and lipoyl protein ligase (LPL), catalytic domain [Acididesulfobacillus acetoxydans]|uniref:Biotinyl protein ligase (BPL) and lipoyl protein ligase (LPL), catalytic domain n=2 Tax=Acididesulfobacillus acetoxydans TaxID=1561005 RepID=A0A8S0XX82_9FIRM|nr:Biotinyl protein ligase (BPL) and lipoyl protein ligase (LPL), catalytic domain [Acididesulfobacillus acetoxydans]CEJ07024.1 lipoyl(octanoyl) transferase [Acididesulfobacillus acetoxydans]